MVLTLWRHGEAGEGVNDRLRALTGSGHDAVGLGSQRFYAAVNTKKLPHPQRILYSPLVRTSQTATIIAATFAHATLTALSALQPDSNVAAVDGAISAHIDADSHTQHMILVSHQPLVSRLVDHYLGGPGSVPFLVPGGLVTLSLEHLAPACGKLLFWALPPDYEVAV